MDLEIGKKDAEHILRSNGFGDIAERVDGCSPNRLFMCFQQVEQLEADSHPLLRRDEFGAAIG